jgi:2-polyprenyl-6-methoxyphenol hydroxylase-like FAD-dependent oxidoreductase
VTGIRGRAHGGRELVEAARIVVGADGSGSLVARGVGAATYDERPARTCAAYSYWADVPVSDAELYPGIGNALIAAPTNDGLTMVICYWPADAVDATRGDVEAAFVAAAERWAPGLADRLHAGRRVERFRGTGQLPNFFRQAHGDGWALVGDAGYTKDPILALGITDAFRDAELLADAIDDGLSGRRPMAEALAGYQQARDAAARAGYESTMQLAALEPPPPEQQSLMAALVDQPDQAGRFFGTLVGTVAPEDFFAPENIGAIMAGAAS